MADQIRTIAICVFRHGDRILVGEAYDPTKKEVFYRPLGGGVEPGELSAETVRREIKEEMGAEIEIPTLLGVLENLFTYDGKRGHEIVFVYDARLSDQSYYGRERFTFVECTGQHFTALWIDLNSVGPNAPPIYPEGLIELLRKEPNLMRSRSRGME